MNFLRATDATCVSAPNWIGYCDGYGVITVNPKLKNEFEVIDFGFIANGLDQYAQQNSFALNTVMQKVSSGDIIKLSSGTAKISSQWLIDKGVIIEGSGGFVGSTLIAMSNASDYGIIIDSETIKSIILFIGAYTGDYCGLPNAEVDWARISDVQVQSGSYRSGNLIDGIAVFGHGIKIDKCHVYSMAQHGIRVEGPVNANANNCVVSDCRVANCGGDGIRVGGYDGNACIIEKCDCTNNGNAQYRDFSFLGNTFISCHADAATGEWGYYANRYGSPTTSVYIGCYSEANAPSYFYGSIAIRGGAIGNVTRNSIFVGETYGRGGYMVSRPQTFSSDFLNKQELWRNHTYSTNDIIGYNGYIYTVTAGGKTADVQHNLPVINGQTVVDGTATLRCDGANTTERDPTIVHVGGIPGTERIGVLAFAGTPELFEPTAQAYTSPRLNDDLGIISPVK